MYEVPHTIKYFQNDRDYVHVLTFSLGIQPFYSPKFPISLTNISV